MQKRQSIFIWLLALGQVLAVTTGAGSYVLCIHHQGEMKLEPLRHDVCHSANPDRGCPSQRPSGAALVSLPDGCGPCLDLPLSSLSLLARFPTGSRPLLQASPVRTLPAPRMAPLLPGPDRPPNGMASPVISPPLEDLRTVVLLA